MAAVVKKYTVPLENLLQLDLAYPTNNNANNSLGIAAKRLMCDMSSYLGLHGDGVQALAIYRDGVAYSYAKVSQINQQSCAYEGWVNPYVRRLADAPTAAVPAAGRRLVATVAATFTLVMELKARLDTTDSLYDSKFVAKADAAHMSHIEFFTALNTMSFSNENLPSFYNYMIFTPGIAPSSSLPQGLGFPPALASAIIREVSPPATRAPALSIGLLVSAGAAVIAFAGCALFNGDDYANKRSA